MSIFRPILNLCPTFSLKIIFVAYKSRPVYFLVIDLREKFQPIYYLKKFPTPLHAIKLYTSLL